MKLQLAVIACWVAMLSATQTAQATETIYNVSETFNQVVYDASHPTWDTMFIGSFHFDGTTVTGLSGTLTQAMSGNTTSVALTYQLSSVYDAVLGGFFVTSFAQNTTDTFSNSGGVANVTGWATGGSKTAGNQNAYATIFVNASNPLATLTQEQANHLAYADCTKGGLMMGTVCMTGWTKVTNGIAGPGGTMKGTFPNTQQLTAAVPETDTYAMLLAGLGVMTSVIRRRATA